MYKHVRIRRTILCCYIMEGSYVLTTETTTKTDLCIFCQKFLKSEKF